MRKLSLIAAAATTALMATSPMAVTGFYVGPKVGPSFNVGHYTSYDVNNRINVHSAKGGAGSAFLGGLNFGYGWAAKGTCLYFGLDFNILWHSLNNEVRKSSDINGKSQPRARLHNRTLYSGALHIGMKLPNHAIPYISLGVTGGSFKLRLHNGSDVAARGLNAHSFRHISKSTAAFTPGIGLKVPLDQKCHVLFGMQYDLMLGGKLSKKFTSNVEAAGTWRYSQKITQHSVTFSLLYRV